MNENPKLTSSVNFPDRPLTERERTILRSIIYNYVLTADPVGSRTLAKRLGINLSPATIRNVMADLEEMGLLTHPHTSAGRIPTTLGYRIYVDSLMQVETLTDDEKRVIEAHLEPISGEISTVIERVGELLAEVSRLLGFILTPDLSSGVLEKVEIVRVSSGRLMVIIIVKSGLVRTIMLELNSLITDEEIDRASRLINSRLVGMRLVDIPKNVKRRLAGETATSNAVVRLFLDIPERIFAPENIMEVHLGPTKYVFNQPEFHQADKMRGIIELIENRDIIVHLLKDRQPGVSVTIGDENPKEQLRDFSVITSTYRIGEICGTMGIIGPTRMNYGKLMALVNFIAQLISERIGQDTINNN